MEYMDGGTLSDIMSFHSKITMTEQQIKWAFWNVSDLFDIFDNNLGVPRNSIASYVSEDPQGY
jgi:hypothetical protein